MTTHQVPIVCDMTDAPDTAATRIADYRRLFHSPAYLGRERTRDGIRFRFHARPGLLEQVQDLTVREQACCAFFDFTVNELGEEIFWDSTVVDHPIARRILDEYYRLPDTAGQSAAELFERFGDEGLTIVIDDGGVRRPATAQELGLDT